MVLSQEVIAELDEKLEIIFDRDDSNKNSEVFLDDKGFLHHETGEVLVQLINSVSLNEETKEYLLLNIFSKIFSNQSLVFYASIHCGIFDTFLENDLVRLNYDFIELISNNLEYFLQFISKDQLNKLNILLTKAESYNRRDLNILIEEIKEYRFNSLKESLSGINIEINKDKEELKSIISYLGFDSKYNNFLIELDKHFNSEEGSIEVAGLIGNFRQFSCDIIIDVAKEVATLGGETEIPRSSNQDVNSPVGHARDYLKIKFELTENEHKFINNFVQILHDEGGHAFLSSMEYFRLTKNIFIEIMLFLLSKLRDLKSG